MRSLVFPDLRSSSENSNSESVDWSQCREVFRRVGNTPLERLTSQIGLGLSLWSSWFSPVWVTSGACWRPSRRLSPLGCFGYGSRRLSPPQTSPWSVLGTSDRLVGYGAHRMAGRRWLSWFSWYFVPWSAIASNNRKRREETFPTFTIGITRQTGLDMILPCLSSYA